MPEAVVFILDADPSMNEQTWLASESAPQSRLTCGKQVIQDMMTKIMLGSKMSQASIIVCKTRKTQHHMAFRSEDGSLNFPNLTELSHMTGNGPPPKTGMQVPRVGIFEHLWEVETVPESEAGTLRGDWLDAIIVVSTVRTIPTCYEWTTHLSLYIRRDMQ
jgi:hypothetical protein